jgi:hypothetical protein
MAMEPKPFDRYRDGTNQVVQHAIPVNWAPFDAPNNGWIGIGPLPTGLHSLPTQQPKPDPIPAAMDLIWGDFGTRSQQCISGVTPGGSCGNFAWLDHRPSKLGDADSTVSWHATDGECYAKSSVPGFSWSGLKLQLGGPRDVRCSRDLIYKNPKYPYTVTRVDDFFPDLNGNGGKRFVLSMEQNTFCSANCANTTGGGSGGVLFPDPSSTGGGRTVGTSGGNPPTPPSTPKPIVKTTPVAPTATNPNPAPVQTSLPAATAVPMANAGG